MWGELATVKLWLCYFAQSPSLEKTPDLLSITRQELFLPFSSRIRNVYFEVHTEDKPQVWDTQNAKTLRKTIHNSSLSGKIISWYRHSDLVWICTIQHWLRMWFKNSEQHSGTKTKNIQNHFVVSHPEFILWRLIQGMSSVCAYPVCTAAWAAVVWRSTSWASVGLRWPFAACDWAPSWFHLDTDNLR